MFKPQVYVVKEYKSSSPCYSDYWKDKDKAIKLYKSVSGKSIVTCKGVTDMEFMFDGCSNLIKLDMSNFDTSNVVDMSCMFYGCKSLSSLDLTGFDTSKVRDMSGMFNECTKLTYLDLSDFDATKVSTLAAMFCNCINLATLDLSNFDTTNAVDMSCMFYGCEKLTSLDLSNYFDTYNVYDMCGMFRDCTNLKTIKGVIDMKSCKRFYEDMFHNCPKLKGVKIKNPPANFDGAGLTSSQYTIVY